MGELFKLVDKLLFDSKVFELGNFWLVIKLKFVKVMLNDLGLSNVKKMKLIFEIVWKVVIDILVYIDNMEEVFYRVLVLFGNWSIYWD